VGPQIDNSKTAHALIRFVSDPTFNNTTRLVGQGVAVGRDDVGLTGQSVVKPHLKFTVQPTDSTRASSGKPQEQILFS
jgi:hypothetical protein